MNLKQYDMSSSSNHSPKRVGITGGIGCGKSTVLKVFAELGVPCFVADQVAAGYYNDPDFVAQVAGIVGPQAQNPDGSANKGEIAKVVFADNEKLERLNALVHPRVRKDFDCWCKRQSEDYVLFESAILYEHGLDKMMDAVVCVYLDKEERIRRVLLRDQTSRDMIESRMNAQMSSEEKMSRADWVVLNYEGNPRRRQVEYIDKQLRKNN